jgi:hypothetical protein
MFNLFKSKKQKLIKKYGKLIKLSYDYSTIDRTKSDQYAAQANEVIKELEKLEE